MVGRTLTAARRTAARREALRNVARREGRKRPLTLAWQSLLVCACAVFLGFAIAHLA
jgi:hypothetical protein